MSVTMRVVRGRKAKNPTYTIRRSVVVHAYEDNTVRATKSFYMGKTENDPKNIENTPSIATLSLDTDNGTRRAYVPIT